MASLVLVKMITMTTPSKITPVMLQEMIVPLLLNFGGFSTSSSKTLDNWESLLVFSIIWIGNELVSGSSGGRAIRFFLFDIACVYVDITES